MGHDGRQKPQCTQSAISSGCTGPPGRVRRAGSRRRARPSRRTRREGRVGRGARSHRPSARGPPDRPAALARSSHGSTRSPPSASACSATACGAPSNRTYIRSSTTSTALGTSPERCRSDQRSAPTTTVAAAAGRGCSRSASRSTRPEPSRRAAVELAEVVARDVLHDLAARVGPGAVRQHDPDADHEVAHRPEPVAQRPREIEQETVRESRVSGWVEREPLPVPSECGLEGREADRAVDDAGQVAGLVLDDAVLRSALHGPPVRAGGRDTAPAPRRRAAASGTACPGWRDRPDRSRCARVSSLRGPPR